VALVEFLSLLVAVKRKPAVSETHFNKPLELGVEHFELNPSLLIFSMILK